MNLGWQDLVVLAAVFAAAAYLARLSWNAVAGKRVNSCGTGCARCSARADVDHSIPEQVVAIGAIGKQPPR
jgi:FeoB-associated Cys-rich membrane protein